MKFLARGKVSEALPIKEKSLSMLSLLLVREDGFLEEFSLQDLLS